MSCSKSMSRALTPRTSGSATSVCPASSAPPGGVCRSRLPVGLSGRLVGAVLRDGGSEDGGRRCRSGAEPEDGPLQVQAHGRHQAELVHGGDRVELPKVHVVGAVLPPVAQRDGGDRGDEEDPRQGAGDTPVPPGRWRCAAAGPDQQEDDEGECEQEEPADVVARAAQRVAGELHHLARLAGGVDGVVGAEDVVVDELGGEEQRQPGEADGDDDVACPPGEEAGDQVHHERGDRSEERGVDQPDGEQRQLGLGPQHELHVQQRGQDEARDRRSSQTAAPVPTGRRGRAPAV